MKQKALRIINLLLAIDFLVIAATAVFNNQIQATGLYFFFHAIPGFVLVALVITHIVLNRKWIKTTYFTAKR